MKWVRERFAGCKLTEKVLIIDEAFCTIYSRIAGDNPLKCVGKDGIINSGQMKQKRKLRAPESHE